MANLGRIVELIICVYIYVAIVRSKMKSKYNWIDRVIASIAIKVLIIAAIPISPLVVAAFVGFLWSIS